MSLITGETSNSEYAMELHELDTFMIQVMS